MRQRNVNDLVTSDGHTRSGGLAFTPVLMAYVANAVFAPARAAP